jgi:methanogen homocitrate synthase
VESGIVASWWLRLKEINMPLVMYPYTWDFVGQKGVEIVLGKKSGRDSIMYKLENLGLQLSSEEVDKVLERVKEEPTKRKSPISDEVFKEIVQN